MWDCEEVCLASKLTVLCVWVPNYLSSHLAFLTIMQILVQMNFFLSVHPIKSLHIQTLLGSSESLGLYWTSIVNNCHGHNPMSAKHDIMICFHVFLAFSFLRGLFQNGKVFLLWSYVAYCIHIARGLLYHLSLSLFFSPTEWMSLIPLSPPAPHQYTEEEGLRLGLCGWVKNTNKGTVIGQIQGPADMVREMWVQGALFQTCYWRNLLV